MFCKAPAKRYPGPPNRSTQSARQLEIMLTLVRKGISLTVGAAQDYSDRVQRGRLYRASGTEDLKRHLDEAAQWLGRAQDAGTNRGISYGADFGGPFLESYPETTGYIIPTLIELAHHYRDPSWLSRAIAAGEWESAIQMREGAVMGGMYTPDPTPAVFNTGMVLLGWSALSRVAERETWRQSADHACDWLLHMQDSDGCWRRGNSRYANATTTTYNVKAAWGLCEAGLLLGREDAIRGATRNAEYCLTQQANNGWFANNCLYDSARPLLHTIAYVMQGLIGIGTRTGRTDFIDAAARTARALIAVMDGSGFIPGCLDREFRPAAKWACLTGSAQTGIVCGQLYRITGDAQYRTALQRLNRYLMRHHDIDNPNDTLRGGVPGSWPVWGEYGRMKVLNWATSFFVDSLLIEQQIA